MLSHQKLKVYGKGLAVVASLAKHSAAWDKRHAVVDQLCSPSESIVLNLAEAGQSRFKQFAVKFAVKFNRVKCPISSPALKRQTILNGSQDGSRHGREPHVKHVPEA